jgi:hypothetical protein
MIFATFEERINDLKTSTDELWDEMTREEQIDHLLPHAANSRALVLGTLNSDEIPSRSMNGAMLCTCNSPIKEDARDCLNLFSGAS